MVADHSQRRMTYKASNGNDSAFGAIGGVWEHFRPFRSVRWALADQAVVSGSNFLSNILLARILGIEEFGRYVLAWTIVLFVQNILSATISSTMLSIGPKQDAEAAPMFFGSMFILQAIFVFVGAALTLMGALVAAYIFPSLGLGVIAVPLTVAVICWQTQDFLRRYFFSIGRAEVSFCSTRCVTLDKISQY